MYRSWELVPDAVLVGGTAAAHHTMGTWRLAVSGASGSYVLTQNISGTLPSAPGFSISLSGMGTETVNLDMNGFAVEGGVAAGNLSSVTIHNGSVGGVVQVTGNDASDKATIKNLSITGRDYGISFQESRQAHVTAFQTTKARARSTR